MHKLNLLIVFSIILLLPLVLAVDPICRDTDGGLNFEEKGTVSGTYQ